LRERSVFALTGVNKGLRQPDESKMAPARRMVMGLGDANTRELRNRIRAARERDRVFNIKRILADGGYTSQEIEQITAAVLAVLRSGDVTKESLERKLVDAGCTREYASHLAAWIAP
jgi:hypothetical protein